MQGIEVNRDTSIPGELVTKPSKVVNCKDRSMLEYVLLNNLSFSLMRYIYKYIGSFNQKTSFKSPYLFNEII